jgi:hypothetical protein
VSFKEGKSGPSIAGMQHVGKGEQPCRHTAGEEEKADLKSSGHGSK